MEEVREIAFYHDRCCICLNKFEQKRAKRKRLTCGDNCRQKLRRLRHPELPALRRLAKQRIKSIDPTHCKICGKYLKQPWTGRRRTTCTDACRMKASRRNYGRCNYCHQPFPKKPSAPNQVYCNEECRTRQRIVEAWPNELRRRSRGIGTPMNLRSPGKPYRVEKLPNAAGEKPEQPPDWWVELKFEDWLNAKKRRNHRFSQPPKWGEAVSTPADRGPEYTVSTDIPENKVEKQKKIKDNVPIPLPKAQQEDDRQKWLRTLENRLASVGIRLDKPYDQLGFEGVEAAWKEYERRVKERRNL